MTSAYLGLGSNVGARHAHLQAAVDGLGRADRVRVEAASPVYETEAHTTDPTETQRPFLNAVLEVAVECDPERLLETAHALEEEEGRERQSPARWSPRPLDVDLLMVGPVTCRSETLILPHPRLADRRFVLQPWADLAPNLVVPPPFDASVRMLLEECPDTAAVRRTRNALSVPSATGPSGADGDS